MAIFWLRAHMRLCVLRWSVRNVMRDIESEAVDCTSDETDPLLVASDRNSQQGNTPAAVLSLGDCCLCLLQLLNFRKVALVRLLTDDIRRNHSIVLIDQLEFLRLRTRFGRMNFPRIRTTPTVRILPLECCCTFQKAHSWKTYS